MSTSLNNSITELDMLLFLTANIFIISVSVSPQKAINPRGKRYVALPVGNYVMD
jgi:hypothetical protein